MSGRRPSNQGQSQLVRTLFGTRTARTSKESRRSAAEDHLVCKACERSRRILKDVVGYCVECSEHLCDWCYSTHLKWKRRGHHQLLDKSRMPKMPIKARHLCEAHPGAVLEYYCKERNQLFCCHCRKLYHKNCRADYFISNVCNDVEDGQEFKSLYQGLTELKQQLHQRIADTNSTIEVVNANRARVQNEIDGFKKELYGFVDRLVDGMFEEVETIVEKDKDTISMIESECETVAGELQDMQTELDVKVKAKDKIQLFIAMKTMLKSRKKLVNKLKLLHAHKYTRTYSFEGHKQLQDAMRYLDKLGHIRCKEAKSESAAEVLSAPAIENSAANLPDRELANTTSIKTERIAAKQKWDKLVSSFTGIELLDNDNIVIVDFENTTVKIVSIHRKTVTNHLPLDAMPWDITKVNKDTFAITLPWESLIQLVSVSYSGSLSLGQTIPVPPDCRGIQYIDDGTGRLIVSCNSRPAKIHIIDMLGNILKELSAGPRLELLRPMYITLNHTQTTVYISDKNTNAVTAMSMDGTVLFTYRDDRLNDPRGLAVGDDGEMFICGSKSNNIHMVSKTGRKIKIIIEEKDGVQTPESIRYDKTRRKLYIGMEDSNYVHVFTLNKMLTDTTLRIT